MRNSILSFAIATVILFAGCSKDSAVNNPVTVGSSLNKPTTETATAFQYVGYGRDGSVVVRGTLTLSISAVGRVTGRWEFRGADPARIGPQVGRGALVGSFENGVLSVNLNPQNSDNNVLLNGRFSRTEYVGRWEWVGFRGVITGGTFRAARSRALAEEMTD